MKKQATEPKKKDGQNEIIRLGLILFLITFVVALMLGVTNSITKEPIRLASEKATQEAMQIVLQEADSFEAVEDREMTEPVEQAALAKKDGETIGYCVKVCPSGFSDVIEIMVGIDLNQTITGVSIISISDTPGLGAKAADPTFLTQFTGKNGPLTVVKNSATEENEVVAVSGATITSTAVTNGVQSALDFAATLQNEGGAS